MLAVVVMAIVLFIVDFTPLLGLWGFLFKVVVGALVYIGTLWLVVRDTVKNGMLMLKKTFMKVSPSS